MNKSPLTTFLLAGLVISVVASVAFCILCTRNTMRLVEIQSQVLVAQTRGAYIAALVKEVVEYSAKNSAIDPILEAANIKPPKNPQVASPKPGSK